MRSIAILWALAWPPILVFGACFGLLGPACAQSYDDYLKMLNEEASEVAPAGVEPTPVEAAPSEPEEAPRVEPVPLSEFEQRLRRDYPGSFLLYRRLDDAGRQRVRDRFAQTGRFDEVRQLILDLAAEQ
jgi:hypothetical protein